MSFTCKGCPERHPGCHAECEKYQKEKAEHDQRREAESFANAVSSGLYGQKQSAVVKAIKHQRRGNKNV